MAAAVNGRTAAALVNGLRAVPAFFLLPINFLAGVEFDAAAAPARPNFLAGAVSFLPVVPALTFFANGRPVATDPAERLVFLEGLGAALVDGARSFSRSGSCK